VRGVQRRADRSRADPEDVADRPVVEVGEVAQEQDGSLTLGQGGDALS